MLLPKCPMADRTFCHSVGTIGPFGSVWGRHLVTQLFLSRVRNSFEWLLYKLLWLLYKHDIFALCTSDIPFLTKL